MSKSKTKPAQKKTKKPSKAPSVKSKVATPPQQEQPKRGRGRPSEYKPEYAELIGNYYLLGMTDVEVAATLGISPQTLYNWKAKYPELLDSDRCKAIADAKVIAAAHKKATGYSYETERVVGKGENARVVNVKVHVPGDATAQQFWLRNRRKASWGDTKQIEVGSPGSFDTFTDDDLDKFIMERQMMDLYDAEPGSDSVN